MHPLLPGFRIRKKMLQREEDTLKEIPQQIVNSAFDAVNELLSIDRLSIAVYNETTHKLEYTSNPVEDVVMDEQPVWRKCMESCFERQVYISEKVYRHCRLLWMRAICAVA